MKIKHLAEILGVEDEQPEDIANREFDEQHVCWYCGGEMSHNPQPVHEYLKYYTAVGTAGDEWICLPCLMHDVVNLIQRVDAAMKVLDQITCILRKDGYLA